ncbi:hypothetical protein AB0I81_23020 [Nonomuraea sp. NPDC050404]|uniref:hypothetical protein n=1 Tax=Nonomuraea sp. NPDC050404 TaxID=3155783 RepID=UPI0033C60304
MPVRSPLRFAEHMLPAPTPILEWAHFWEWLDSQRPQPAPRPTGHNPDLTVMARVDEGRWIADCPWGCGVSFNLPRNATTFWCTECAGGGWGNTAELAWPDRMPELTVNLESLPAILQFWPCASCLLRPAVGLCATCKGMHGEAT